MEMRIFLQELGLFTGTFKGWKKPTHGNHKIYQFTKGGQRYLKAIENLVNVKISYISPVQKDRK